MTTAEKLTQIAENEQKVYKAGKRDLMAAVQDYGARTRYNLGFTRWNLDAFYPVYDIIATGATPQMFSSAIGAIDLSARLEECKVKLDTGGCTTLEYMFLSSQITRVPEIDTRGMTQLNYIFNSASTIVTIDNLVLKDDGSQTFAGVFDWAGSLQNIKITGVIGKNGFNVQHATRLTYDSLVSIINALQDKSADTSGTAWTVTIGATNYAKLTEGDIALAEQKGWQLV